METKQCSKCREVKPLSDFHKDATRKNGLKSRCKACISESSSQYHQKDVETSRAKCRAFYHSRKADAELHAADLARRREVVSLWRERNRRRVSGLITQWRKNNPERHKAIMHRRKARKLGSEGSFTAEEWQELCARYGYRCLACGKKRKLTADHIQPLIKNGTSYIENIQPLCGPCNSSKGDKTIDYR